MEIIDKGQDTVLNNIESSDILLVFAAIIAGVACFCYFLYWSHSRCGVNINRGSTNRGNIKND